MSYVILVDGNNLAWKAIHAYDLKTSSGEDTSAIYGFLSQFISTMNGKKLRTVVVWDGGYPERTAMTNAAIEKGFIKSGYKTNRTSFEERQLDPKLSTIEKQMKCIQEVLSYTDVKQVVIAGQEADDVIASYCEKIKEKAKVLCLTCDHDYYQLIDDNVAIISRWKGVQTLLTKTRFIQDYGIEPYQWVEVGALCGDSSDSIEGVPGCGETTALEYIKKYQTVTDLLVAMEDKFAPLRLALPDVGTQNEIENLLEAGGKRGKSFAFEGVYVGMPFSGVALALAKEEIKNIKKIELKFAMYKERILLARNLKRMNRNINVPNITFTPSFKKDKFDDFCNRYELKSLINQTEVFDLS